MSFENSFRDELGFLREQASYYADLRPHLSHYFLNRHADPDAQRLYEGFAFLTGGVKGKINDHFPEITHAMMNLLWPNYLRPFPSIAIIEMTPHEGAITTTQVVKAGVNLKSHKIEGIECVFKTSRPVTVHPLSRTRIHAVHSREMSIINLDYQLYLGASLHEVLLDELTFFLGTQENGGQNLYFWIQQYLQHVVITVNGQSFKLPKSAVIPVGLATDERLLPVLHRDDYEGYRLMHEYFAYPDGFNFITLKQLSPVFRNMKNRQFTLSFQFNRPLPASMEINEQHFRLFCTPAVNLFTHDSEPIDLSGMKAEYPLMPQGYLTGHFEIFSVDDVTGWLCSVIGRLRGDGMSYLPYESFQHKIEHVNHRKIVYYRVRMRDAVIDNGFQYSIAFIRDDESLHTGMKRMLSVNLTCTNCNLPTQLACGDICQLLENEPEFVDVANITVPSMSLRPMVDHDVLWSLLSNLSLNYLSLQSVQSLRTILRAYDFRALVDRQAEGVSKSRLDDGIISIESRPVDRIFKGALRRGIHSELTLKQSAFVNVGDLYMFGVILSRFFGLYVTIDSFHELVVVNQERNERYQFGMQVGCQPLI